MAWPSPPGPSMGNNLPPISAPKLTRRRRPCSPAEPQEVVEEVDQQLYENMRGATIPDDFSVARRAPTRPGNTCTTLPISYLPLHDSLHNFRLPPLSHVPSIPAIESPMSLSPELEPPPPPRSHSLELEPPPPPRSPSPELEPPPPPIEDPADASSPPQSSLWPASYLKYLADSTSSDSDSDGTDS
ncbi:hypothetical protein Pmani_018901 [Petrolisthes manimaculis]|uniref:Uncharacterized protein n=1 Tax=Petrolisthes manimaculis TaxID=1843537 RepID=A0AAE1U685_9EUCA|nr:hypothetical protein Pmani_018901 [Petrolisthes manimaculis]